MSRRYSAWLAHWIARIDRRIGRTGRTGELNQTWEAASIGQGCLSPKEWLRLDQQRWGIESRTHHTLDVARREDDSRVSQSNAAT